MEISRLKLGDKYYALRHISGFTQDHMGNAVFGYTVLDDGDEKGCITVGVSRTCLAIWKHTMQDLTPEQVQEAVGRISALVLAHIKLPVELNDLIQIYPEAFKIMITSDQDFYDEQTRTLHIRSYNSPAELLKHVALDDDESDERLQAFILDLLKQYRDWSFEQPIEGSNLPKSEMPFNELLSYWFFANGKLLSNLDALSEETKIKLRSVDRGIVSAAITQTGIKASKEVSLMSEPPVQVTSSTYIKPELIKAFENKQSESDFNFRKLVKLLAQLNQNYALSNEYASAMLIRGILDHIPPLLGQANFNQVVSGYAWGRTDKEYMQQLLNSKPISDDVLHRQISGNEDLIEITNLPSSVYMNRLLQECLASKSPLPKPLAASKSKKSSTDITIKNNEVLWANWSGLTRSFQAIITIDNFNNPKPNFIEKVCIKATDSQGDPWVAETFKFQQLPLNTRYKIEPYDKQDDAVLISQQSDPNAQPGLPMPDIDIDKVNVEFAFADGAKKVIVCKAKPNS
jgi:hypothetical protein